MEELRVGKLNNAEVEVIQILFCFIILISRISYMYTMKDDQPISPSNSPASHSNMSPFKFHVFLFFFFL